jgi:two-component system sensor histidine kinase/response regulator
MAKILVIDDTIELREEIESLLELEGYEVISADNGIQGLELARSMLPDLIICDVNMAGLDGYEVFKELHAHKETEFIPFIFLTAMSSKHDLRLGMNLGADDYLTKPYEQDELLNAIQTRLMRSNAVQDASHRKAQAEKEQLIQRISQELRNPVTSMKLATTLIEQLLGEKVPPHMARILDTYQHGVSRLQRMTEQMIVQVKLEAESISPESIQEEGRFFGLQELVEAAIGAARFFAYERNYIELRVSLADEGVKVFGEFNLLEQALGEVIANALDFSGENSSVAIRHWEKDGMVSILVVDEGHGIPANEVDQVLLPFRRASRDEASRKGLGLGLTLAQEILSLHGGRFKICSSKIGTSVLIQLPIAKR